MSLRYAARNAINRANMVAACGTLFLFSLVCLLSSLGGYLNRLRGGLWHWQHDNTTENTVYWRDHILPRLVVGLGSSFLSCSFQDYRVSILMLLQTWFSLYTGWGCYFSFHRPPLNPCGRVAFADWILGRQDRPGWSYSRRTILNYAGMSWRGLQWTGPTGFLMWRRGCGSLFLLGGSLMAPVYFFSQLNTGNTAYSEWAWGAFIWAFIILAYLRNVTVYGAPSKFDMNTVDHRRLTMPPTPLEHTCGRFYQNCLRQFRWFKTFYRWFNWITAYLITFILIGSCMFYSLVVQSDDRNKAQTMFGLFTSCMSMVLLLTHYRAKGHYLRRVDLALHPKPLSRSGSVVSTRTNSSTISLPSNGMRQTIGTSTTMVDDNYASDGTSDDDDQRQDEAPIGRDVGPDTGHKWLQWVLWTYTCPSVFVCLEGLLRFAAAANIIVTVALTCICFIANIHTDRMIDTR